MILLIGCSTGDEYESPEPLPEQLTIDLDMANIEIKDVWESEVTIFEEDNEYGIPEIYNDYITSGHKTLGVMQLFKLHHSFLTYLYLDRTVFRNPQRFYTANR
jgi:hypothetical protein